MNTTPSSGHVTVRRENKVARIEFFHPLSNAFPSSQLQALTQTIRSLKGDPSIQSVVLESVGNGAFCAGASFDELLEVEDSETGLAFFSGFAHVINAMRDSDKLFIGRIHGKAVGGGVGLAAACDYCLATDHASIKLSELAIGIGPFVIEPAVSRKIGSTAFAQLSLEAHEWKSASWAEKHGLYDQVFSTVEQLDQAIEDISTRLSQYNPEALQEMKRIFWQGTSHWDRLLVERAAISGKLVRSEFTKNALNQFKKKN